MKLNGCTNRQTDDHNPQCATHWKRHITQISNFQTIKKFYLKYGLNLKYLLNYIAETKVILREMYSILIGNDSLLKRPQVI